MRNLRNGMVRGRAVGVRVEESGQTMVPREQLPNKPLKLTAASRPQLSA